MKFILKSLSVFAITAFTPAWCQILIQQPDVVRAHFNNGVIQGSTAAFGTPIYGEMILGQLVYGESDDISRPHCTANYTIPEETEYPKIVIVKRGGCQFAEKVLVAQNKEAFAVIVVDDDPMKTPEQIRLVIMADDRRKKRDIRIPSILITYEEGERLISEVNKNTNIIVRLEWDMPNEHTVNVDMWSSVSIPDTSRFLKSFSPIAREFKYDIDFVPHFWIFELPLNGMDMDMCTETTPKYCSFDPDLKGKLTGRDVVNESVRQYCLWDKTAKRNTTDVLSGRFSEEFWRYVELIGEKCPVVKNSPVARLTDECSYGLMSQLGVDVNRIKMCFRDEFEDILEKQKTSLAWSPSALMVNNYRYSGPLDAELVTRAICTGFISEPHVCLKTQYVAEDVIRHNNSFPWWGYVVIATSFVAILLITVAVYRFFLSRIQRQLRYEVFEEVNNRLDKNGTSKTGAHTPDTSRGDFADNISPNKNFVDIRII